MASEGNVLNRMGGKKMMRPGLTISCDRTLGQMYSEKFNQSLCNLPSIKIDEVDEDMGCNNFSKRSSLRRSSYKSVLPRKLGRLRTQVSQSSSPQESHERLNVRGLKEQKVNIYISKVRRRKNV